MESAAHLGITVAGQDDFLLGLLELYPDAVLDALRRQSSRYRREPRSAAALLGILAGPGQDSPEFARQCRTLLLLKASTPAARSNLAVVVAGSGCGGHVPDAGGAPSWPVAGAARRGAAGREWR